ncbi:30S ribosome-binding factor RbfA [Vulgatibacter sp.]|uniref:30S ribosome-binding factor RbfA n=1 Tax=Vulgatibacter sp. TaxID=1971226 RepID=UPI003567F738
MAHDRPQRVGQLIQEELGRLVTKGFKDPRIGFVTFTGVKVSPDLRQAVVYWSMFGADEAQRNETAAGLKAATGFMKREIGSALSLRYVPDLRFVYDEAIDRGDRIDRLLRQVKEEEAARTSDDEAPGVPGGENES